MKKISDGEQSSPYPRPRFSSGGCPHWLENTTEEWNHYSKEIRRKDAARERDRIKKALPRKIADTIQTKLIGCAQIIDCEKEIYQDLPASEIEFYEECRDEVAMTISNWIANGEFGEIRKLSDQVKKRKKMVEVREKEAPVYSSSSDQVKSKALEIVSTYLAEERRLITQEELLKRLRARMDAFLLPRIEANYRMLEEIGLNGLPQGKRGPKLKS